jgi:hypothetical protein
MSESSQAVFISYTPQDAHAARRICDSLRAAGIEVWLDQSELRGGDAWDSAIRKRIKTCAPASLFANWAAEVERLMDFRWKPYVPVAAHRQKAAKTVAKLAKKGQALSPVTASRGAIAKSFWASRGARTWSGTAIMPIAYRAEGRTCVVARCSI